MPQGRILNANRFVSREVIPYANFTLKAKFQFGRRTGAFLAMYKPFLTKLPDKLLVDHLHDPSSPLRRKKIVTSVYSCNSYALYLSNGREYLQFP